ncbi:hypothetical protein KUTeg_016476 [Tegillarca granosa]|uniref:Uncharacterized protein n=1 Tax=Tegillarca granosa TaxID=220873 RepID=A0ABQ9EKY9_TEGGR|nr:hypothetical protein KUTeg_016476 [Tegillarca granosa]
MVNVIQVSSIKLFGRLKIMLFNVAHLEERRTPDTKALSSNLNWKMVSFGSKGSMVETWIIEDFSDPRTETEGQLYKNLVNKTEFSNGNVKLYTTSIIYT